MKLTDEQQRALDFTRNISVTAGAGAGKTRLLVERFMEIALKKYQGQPHKVRKILAITFTNKAAGEMRERIAQAVNERLQTVKEPALRRHLLGIRDQLNSVSISTIHSFCARILREYPIEAGLPPDFSELDEMQSNLLINQAIDHLFETLNTQTDAPQKERLFALFQAFEPQKVRTLLRQALLHPYEMETIVQRWSQFETAQDFLQFVSQLWLKAIHQVWPQTELQKLFHLANQLTGSLKPNARPKAFSAYQALLDLAKLAPKQSLDLPDFKIIFQTLETFTTSQNTAYKNLNQLGGKASWIANSEALLLQLSELSAQLLSVKKTFDPGPPPEKSDELFFEPFKTILDLYQATRAHYEKLKAEIPALDFEDLLIKVWQLLRSNSQVRNELNQRFDFIMVDEFQDTNALQWQIIELMAEQNGQLHPHKIFVVGDPKQSIYGFRNADIRIFKTVKETLATNAGFSEINQYPGNIVLKNSFRFLPRLNAFVNEFFAELLQAHPANVYEVEFESLQAKRTKETAGHLELALLAEEEQLNEEDYIAHTIQQLVREQPQTCHENHNGQEKERPLTFGDIAILLRSRSALLNIEQALRRWNIPFKTVKGIGFWQQQEIYDFYHLLNFLALPENDFYLTALLRSKLFLLPDPVLFVLNQQSGANLWQKLQTINANTFSKETLQQLKAIYQLLQRWIHLRDLIPLGDLLRTVLDDLKYHALISAQINGEQLLANIEKFIDHVFRFNKSGMNGLLELIEQVEILIEEHSREGEPQINLDDRSTVKIMTIHAAKGLQFPVVFVPYLNTTNLDTVHQTVFLEPEIGLATAFRAEFVTDSNAFSLLNLLKMEKRKRELAEAKRIFYVAVTRASEHLFLSARIKNNSIQDHSVLQWLYDFLARRQLDLLSPETTTFQGKGYQLHVTRTYPTTSLEQDEIKHFFEGLNHLKQMLQNPPAIDEQHLQPYRPLKDSPGPIIFSATRLMTYVENPQNYYHRYHLGFFESDYQLFAENIYQTDDSLVKGKIFHRFLELLDQPGTDERQLLERIFFEFEVFDPDKQQQLREEIKTLKEKIYHSPTGKTILTAPQARNELTITMRLGEDFFTGTIDRLIKNPQGYWQVIDYKTNRISAAQVPAKAKEYDWQMKGYALLLSQLYPQQKVYPVALFFVYPDVLFEETYSSQQIEAIKNEYVELIRQIKTQYPVND